ncbi:MAG TPA: MmcQ/YjbR family DNA-binding protein [Longimicrobium sp.]|jgi:hypothetical protein
MPVPPEEDSLECVRRVCLALPEAFEQEAWGAPTFRVRKRIFAMFSAADKHHGGGRDGLWLGAPLGVQEIVVRSEPEKFFVPPYVGVKGWIGVYVDAVDDDELHSLAVQSYCIVAPKKLQALVSG